MYFHKYTFQKECCIQSTDVLVHSRGNIKTSAFKVDRMGPVESRNTNTQM
jgi:hypothetical protein